MARFRGKFSWRCPILSKASWPAYLKLPRHQPNPPHSRWPTSRRRPQHPAGVTRPHSIDATVLRKSRSRTHADMGFTPHYPSQRFWGNHSLANRFSAAFKEGRLFFALNIDLLNRPTGMLRDEWLSIFGGSLQGRKG